MTKDDLARSETQRILRTVAEAAGEKKASRIMVMDMRGLSSIADYFFICSAENERQVGAIVRNIEERLDKLDCSPIRMEGLTEARWVVMDYGDILVHVYLDEVRKFYSLEKLWGDAPRVPVEEVKEG